MTNVLNPLRNGNPGSSKLRPLRKSILYNMTKFIVNTSHLLSTVTATVTDNDNNNNNNDNRKSLTVNCSKCSFEIGYRRTTNNLSSDCFVWRSSVLLNDEDSEDGCKPNSQRLLLNKLEKGRYLIGSTNNKCISVFV